MKKTLLITLFLLVTQVRSFSQQMNNWYIGPYKIDMTLPTPVPSIITPAFGSNTAATAVQSANGFYDNNGTGSLIFYTTDGNVYDYNNTLIGTIPNGASEIAIVPFGTNIGNTCQRKYNIFTTFGGFQNKVFLFHTVLDMNSYSLTTTKIDSMPFGSEFGAIAVGQENNLGDRYLYFLVGSGTNQGPPSGRIDKLTIFKNGTVGNSSVLYPTTNLPNNYPGIEIFTRELDLSPDGNWLAWASYEKSSVNSPFSKYHLLALNNTTGEVNTSYGSAAYQQFNIAAANDNYNTAGFRGVEFYQFGNTTRLFMGAGNNGIYYNEISIPFVNNPIQVLSSGGTNTSTYGLSQIELAYNGFMYSGSGRPIMNIGAFNPSAFNPYIILSINTPSFNIPNPPKATYSAQPYPNSTLYTLPDQIDGQDYSTLVQAPSNPVYTIDNYTDSSTNSTQQVWTDIANPFGNNGTVYVTQNLTIGTSNHENLKISNMKFKFSPNAKLIIKPGCTLTLDQTTLTSTFNGECPDNKYTWKGVEVWGNSNSNQNGIGATLIQGKLIMTNSSRIEYAEIGASAQKPTDASKRGGIIISTSGSTFYNCGIGVKFLTYKNIIGTTEFGNKSFFSATNFQNDIHYPFATAPVHAYLDNCIGIRFISSNFTNFSSLNMFSLPSIGIKAMNANFTITGSSSFSNLYHAIDANKSQGNNTYSIFNSTFTDNEVGIYNNGVNNFIVQKCTLNIGGNLKGAAFHYGIRNWYGTGFSIEENNFLNPSTSISPKKIGIMMTNTGTAGNEIYKNKFYDLTHANYATGQNRANFSCGNLQGLQWLCNENYSNIGTDLYALGHNSNSGVRLFQGTSSSPAENLFSTTASTINFNNSTLSPVNYYYHLPITTFNSNNVIPVPITNTNTCPSHICAPPCNQQLLAINDVNQLYSDYQNAEDDYLNLLYSYNQLMDGGNTNLLLNQMQQNWSSDAIQLRDELLALSPYLSQQVLIDAAKRNILPDAMMLMICLANPDATRSDDFLRFLQYNCPNPLPSFMINLIISSWNSGTIRTEMENILANYNQKMAFTSNKIINDLYQKNTLDVDSTDHLDTTNISNQICYWLNHSQTIEAKYDLVEYYYNQQLFTLAENTLLNIPTNFNLTDDQLTAYNDYTYFYYFKKSHLLNGQNLSELNESDLQTLISFASIRENFATALAQNTLCFYYDICRNDESIESSSNRIAQHVNNSFSFNFESLVNNNSVKVIPNPAIDFANFYYYLESLNGNADLGIYDNTGKLVTSFIITSKIGELKWDISTINNGIYTYQVTCNKTILTNGKLSIKK
jgi:hypothetical protein